MDRRQSTRTMVIGASVISGIFASQQTVSLAQQVGPPAPPMVSTYVDGPVVIDGFRFNSKAEYYASD